MLSTVGLGALTHTDAGARIDPQAPEDWDEWISASRTRNFCEDDPLLDWLERYGAQHGFARDDELDGYDSRTDIRAFVFERGRLFEECVVRLIRERFQVVRISTGYEDVRALEKAEETLAAMVGGVEVVEQAVLRNPQNRTYGAVDLLFRSDALNRLVPECIEPEEAAVNAPALGDQQWHYRAVDIKFHTLDLLADGQAGSGLLAFMVQVWIYNEALGRLQGYHPPASYLLGRCWTQGKKRGLGCFEKVARIDHARVHNKKEGRTVAETASAALDWIRKLRREGAEWRVLPEPSVPELYPHARNTQDQPWRSAKSYLARELAELTLLPAMDPGKRRRAHAQGLKRWDDLAVSAARLGVVDPRYAPQCDAVLAANRGRGGQAVFPDRIGHADLEWRPPARLEVYVDFETVSNLDDDFSRLPMMGGQALIFQIGCGWYEDLDWRFKQWTVDSLTEPAEASIIDGWTTHLHEMLEERALSWADARIFHWSPAEWVNLSSAYNSARQRHPEMNWPPLCWFDFLNKVVRVEPVTVRGAFNFGLKSIARAMHTAGLIEANWDDSPIDGLGAMIGAWWCSREAARLGVSIQELELMKEIGRYNEVDCRAMAEIVAWLRANR
jgi:hypothetical protein